MSVRRHIAVERDAALGSPAHDERTAAILGIALGIAFATSFLTGVYSHLLQHPVSWLHPPTRPVGLYRVTQGVHVATGLASIPLLLAKLWSVYPKLFRWPPADNVAVAVERTMLVPLVCGSVFMLFTGLENIARWYPWPFFFPRAHYWVAWITIGALVTHIGAKAVTARKALQRRPPPDSHMVATTPPGAMSRRTFLAAAGSATGFLTLATVGQTVTPLGPLVLFAPRRPDIGSQDLPVNRAAIEAAVTDAALSPGYRLHVGGAVDRELFLTSADLETMANAEASLPIACVEGWSKSARWRGVPVPVLLRAAGVTDDRPVTVEVVSLEPDGLYRASTLDDRQARDRSALVATHLNGERLDLDHGYPCRLVAPNRPGVLQTKWLSELVIR